MGGVEEVLWAVMAGADKYEDGGTGGGLKTTNTADNNPDAFTMAATVAGSRTPGLYSINDNTGCTGTAFTTGSLKAFEIEVTVDSNGDITKVQVISGGFGAGNGQTIEIPAAEVGGTAFTLTIESAGVTTVGASFYRNSQQDPNSPFGPAVIEPAAAKSVINFGQSNRSTLGECDIYFIMETSTTIPMVYKLENAAVNEASIDFEVDGIATVSYTHLTLPTSDLV